MFLCEQQVDQEGHSCKTCVCLYEQSVCVCAGLFTMGKYSGGRGKGRGKRCCLCRLSAMRSSYLWNMCVTVCGWGVGAQQLPAASKTNRASKKGILAQVVHQLLRFLLKSCYTHSQSHTHKHKTCWFSETGLRAGGFPLSTGYCRSLGGKFIRFFMIVKSYSQDKIFWQIVHQIFIKTLNILTLQHSCIYFISNVKKLLSFFLVS